MDPDRVRATLAARAQKDSSVAARLRRIVELDRALMATMGGMSMPGGMMIRTGAAAEAAQSAEFREGEAELSRELGSLAYDVAGEDDDVEEIATWLSYNAESVLESIAGPLPRAQPATRSPIAAGVPALVREDDLQELVHQLAARYRRRRMTFVLSGALLIGIALVYQFGLAGVREGVSDVLVRGISLVLITIWGWGVFDGAPGFSIPRPLGALIALALVGIAAYSTIFGVAGT